MVRIKRAAAVLVLLAAALTLYAAVPLEDYIQNLDEKQREALFAGDVISHDSTVGNALRLLPPETLIAEKVSEFEINENSLFTECMSFIEYPDYFASMSQREQMVHSFNTLRSLSTQEGITYISFRKGNKPALLIEESHVTDRVGGRKELEDPVMDYLPVGDRLIVFQKDTSFKNNYYEYEYHNTRFELFQQVTNKTDMRVLGLIPAVRRDVMNINTSVIFTDKGMLAYSLAVAENQKSVISILGYRVHLPSAFQRRITAVLEWFVDRLEVNQHDF
jgi:hypothetical protein